MTKLRVLVVGQGVAGAMAGAFLAKSLGGDRFAVTSVPVPGADESVGPFGPIEASDPAIRPFHAELGIDDAQLVRGIGASFGLGTSCVGWSAEQPDYFAPFGDIGATIEGAAFHHHLVRLRAEGHDQRFRTSRLPLSLPVQDDFAGQRTIPEPAVDFQPWASPAQAGLCTHVAGLREASGRQRQESPPSDD